MVGGVSVNISFTMSQHLVYVCTSCLLVLLASYADIINAIRAFMLIDTNF